MLQTTSAVRGGLHTAIPPRPYTLTGQPRVTVLLPGTFTIQGPDDHHAPDLDRQRCAYCGVKWKIHPKKRNPQPAKPRADNMGGLRKLWNDPDWRSRKSQQAKRQWANAEFRHRQRERAKAQAQANWNRMTMEEREAWREKCRERMRKWFDDKTRPGYSRVPDLWMPPREATFTRPDLTLKTPAKLEEVQA